MAPAKKAKGTAARKVKDKWKAKTWYKVHAPRMFNEVVIGETPSADPEYLIGRTADVTVQDLTGDFSKMHIKLKFKIVSAEGEDAKTVFIGHELTSDYVRRLTRRKKTKTDHVVDVKTTDGFVIRIKPMSIAEKRIQSSQEDGMRAVMDKTLKDMGTERSLSDIVKAIVSGDLAKELARACRVVIPVKRIEIRKSEILAFGEGDPESIMEVVAPAAPEPVEEASEEEPEAEADEPEESEAEPEEAEAEEESSE